MGTRNEFKVHRLSLEGLQRADQLAEVFSTALDEVEDIVAKDDGEPAPAEVARCLALVRTKMQEASFFAKRALAISYSA